MAIGLNPFTPHQIPFRDTLLGFYPESNTSWPFKEPKNLKNGTIDMPNYGASDSPAQMHLSKSYLENSPHEIGIPNVVTAILASYRGFDTLGEVAVVFTAGVGVILLLSGVRRRKRSANGRGA